MDTNKIWLIIGGMALVTAVPRLLPYYLIGRRNLSPTLQEWLKLLPTVIFASMIAPPLLVENGAFNPAAHAADITTVMVAGLIAYFTRNLALSLGGSVALLLAIQYFG